MPNRKTSISENISIKKYSGRCTAVTSVKTNVTDYWMPLDN